MEIGHLDAMRKHILFLQFSLFGVRGFLGGGRAESASGQLFLLYY